MWDMAHSMIETFNMFDGDLDCSDKDNDNGMLVKFVPSLITFCLRFNASDI